MNKTTFTYLHGGEGLWLFSRRARCLAISKVRFLYGLPKYVHRLAQQHGAYANKRENSGCQVPKLTRNQKL